jgi:hypothetical protein
MAKVYRFRMYVIKDDESLTSRRWATREAIKRIGGEVLEGTETEVDASVLDSDGMTERDFDPHRRTGFQRQVT